MIIETIQFANLGELRTTALPIRFQRTPLESAGATDTCLLTGRNSSGKTTLMAGLYFVLGGHEMLNGRKVPGDIMTDGQSDLTVAITVPHHGEAQDMTWGVRRLVSRVGKSTTKCSSGPMTRPAGCSTAAPWMGYCLS